MESARSSHRYLLSQTISMRYRNRSPFYRHLSSPLGSPPTVHSLLSIPFADDLVPLDPDRDLSPRRYRWERSGHDLARVFVSISHVRKAHPRARGAASSAFPTHRRVQKVRKMRGRHGTGTWRRKETRDGTVVLTDGRLPKSGCRKSSWKRGREAMVLRADVALSRETHVLGSADEEVERRAGSEEVR